MTDDFLRDAQERWRGHNSDYETVRRRLRRTRWAPHALLGLEFLGAAAAFAVGLWFLATALTTRDPLFGLSALVMLGALPALTMVSFWARRGTLRWEVETPEGVVRHGLRRAEASLQAIRVGYWGATLVAGFVLVLWLAELAGAIHARDFLILYTAVSAAICGPYLLYLGWRRRHVLRERAACLRLLDQFGE